MALLVLSVTAKPKNEISVQNKGILYQKQQYAACIDSAKKAALDNKLKKTREWARRAMTYVVDSTMYYSCQCMIICVDLLDGKRAGTRPIMEQAINYFASRRDNESLMGLATAYSALGYYEYETETEPQDRSFKKAERVARQLGDVEFEELCLLMRCNLYLRNERYVEAAHTARRMLSLSDHQSKERMLAQMLLMKTYSRINASAAVRDYSETIEREGYYLKYPTLSMDYYQVKAEDRLNNGHPEEALEISDKALALTVDCEVSRVQEWCLNLQRATILVVLGRYAEAKKHIEFCRHNISIIDPRQCDGAYSRYHVDLIEARVAVGEQKYAEAESILDNAAIPYIMLTRARFADQYNKIFENVYAKKGDYTGARYMLQSNIDLRKYVRAEHARMRTKDMEIAYREDTTIVRQRQTLATDEQDIFDIESQLMWWAFYCLLILTGLALFVVWRWRYRKDRKQAEAMERNKLLQDKVKSQTEQNRRQNQLIMQKNEDIMSSQAYATRLQQGILPESRKLKELGMADAFVIRHAVGATSGSFYWFRKMGDRVMVCCANSISEGVPGAMLSMVCITLMNDTANLLMQNCPASDVLEDLDNRLVGLLPDDKWRKGFEMAVALVDPGKHTINISSGAQYAMVVIDEKAQVVLPTDRMIGDKRTDEKLCPFEDYQYNYNDGDSFYLFTSGLLRMRGVGTGRELGVEGVANVMERVCHLPASLRKEAVLTELQLWKNGRPLNDDLLIIGVAL